jgi:hypothetical protein
VVRLRPMLRPDWRRPVGTLADGMAMPIRPHRWWNAMNPDEQAGR